MRIPSVAWIAIALIAGAPLPAIAANPSELYLRGDIGISFGTGDADGSHDFLATPDSGEDDDASPVYGVAAGVSFPMNRALPWRWRTPALRIPYWPGKAIEREASDDSGFPDWPVSFEVEYLRGRNFDYVTQGVPNDPYRSEIDSWTVMGNLRLDFPVRPAVQQLFGRVPLLDPMTVYVGGGAGLAMNEVEASIATDRGSEEAYGFAWQAGLGFGYQLTERVRWSAGWRYVDLGDSDIALRSAAGVRNGSYSVDLGTHEFATSLTFAFWRVSFLDDD